MRLLTLLIAGVGLLLTGCWDSRNLVTYSTKEPVLSLTVRDGTNQLLWEIGAVQPRRLSYVEYSRIPVGYRQVFPVPPLKPRPFRTGEEVSLSLITESERFDHDGRATDVNRFEGGVWHVMPLHPGK